MLYEEPTTRLAVPRILIPDQFNVASAILDRNIEEGRGAKTAIYYGSQSYTYAQVTEMANRVGNGLLALGVEMEQRIALIALDSPEFAASFFGAIKMGAVPVPVNTMLRPTDYVYILNDSRTRVLITHANLWQMLQGVLPQLKYLRNVVIITNVDDGSSTSTATGGKLDIYDFAAWTASSSADLLAAETSKDDSAFWLYSSGSTGFPKGCVHLQHDMLYCTEYYAKPVLNITENDITFSA